MTRQLQEQPTRHTGDTRRGPDRSAGPERRGPLQACTAGALPAVHLGGMGRGALGGRRHGAFMAGDTRWGAEVWNGQEQCRGARCAWQAGVEVCCPAQRQRPFHGVLWLLGSGGRWAPCQSSTCIMITASQCIGLWSNAFFDKDWVCFQVPFNNGTGLCLDGFDKSVACLCVRPTCACIVLWVLGCSAGAGPASGASGSRVGLFLLAYIPRRTCGR